MVTVTAMPPEKWRQTVTEEKTLDNYVIPHTNGQLAGCPSCRRIFGGDKAFDAHRVGSHGVDRKCAENPQAVGLRLDSRGFWGKPFKGVKK
jgi:hypothetical protein